MIENKKIKILIACEESQAVCKAFRKLGHEAYSCDLEDCTGGHPEWHIKENAVKVMEREYWDGMIAFPTCTFLTYAATRHWNAPGRAEKREDGLEFFMKFINAPIKHIAVENPMGYPNTVYRKPDQIIHPYYFGDKDKKRTCLWLKNLPKLIWTKERNLFFPVTAAPEPEPLYINKSGKRIFFSEGAVGRSKNKKEVATLRSKTFPTIATAMATQWSEYILNHKQ